MGRGGGERGREEEEGEEEGDAGALDDGQEQVKGRARFRRSRSASHMSSHRHNAHNNQRWFTLYILTRRTAGLMDTCARVTRGLLINCSTSSIISVPLTTPHTQGQERLKSSIQIRGRLGIAGYMLTRGTNRWFIQRAYILRLPGLRERSRSLRLSLLKTIQPRTREQGSETLTRSVKLPGHILDRDRCAHGIHRQGATNGSHSQSEEDLLTHLEAAQSWGLPSSVSRVRL